MLGVKTADKFLVHTLFLIVVCVAGVFFYLWKKELNEQRLLQKNGIETHATVLSLYQTKTSKRASPNYYMEVGFFANSETESNIVKPNKTSKNRDELIVNIASLTQDLSKPLGNYVTQIIPLPNYEFYKKHTINNKVKIRFLKNNPNIIQFVP